MYVLLYSVYSYLIMMLPSPSFPLAIIKDSHMPASMMLVMAKITITFYLWREYKIKPFSCCRELMAKRKLESEFSDEIEMHML